MIRKLIFTSSKAGGLFFVCLPSEKQKVKWFVNLKDHTKIIANNRKILHSFNLCEMVEYRADQTSCLSRKRREDQHFEPTVDR